MWPRVFSGLVQALGVLRAREPRGPGERLRVEGPWADLVVGESIAVNGACLTVVSATERTFTADVSAESMARTTLGALRTGAAVNLERALALGDRLGGHLVSGHVDAVASVLAVESVGDAWRVRVALPPSLARFVAEKGSITIEGVSLTVNALHDGGASFELMLIPHSWASTTLRQLRAGSLVNVEVDLVARYAVRWLEATSVAPAPAGLEAALARAGMM